MKQLHFISLHNATFQPAWLTHLTSLNKLTRLDVAGTSFADAVAGSITKIKSLQAINAASTDLGKRGLMQLLQLPKLQSIALNDTKIKDETLQQARRSRPDLRITHQGVFR